jgi:hypothetical protein
MPAALFLLADKAANVTSGAVLTLVLPLGFTIIALSIWWYDAKRSGAAPESSEFTGPRSEPPTTTPPE